MRKTTQCYGLRWDVPFNTLSEREKNIVIKGRGNFCGIRGFFEWLESKRYKVHLRVMLARFRSYAQCPDCGGARLVPEALNVRVLEKTIAQLCAMPIEQLHLFFDRSRFSPDEIARADRIIQEIENRLQYLTKIGLGYLTLNRQTRTLSGGEAQRINLATALGSALTETLYVLDEPTVGLHARDTNRLLGVVHSLRDKGNTIVVVEHDPAMIRGADYVIDLGPAAGERGGEILFRGAVADLLKNRQSVTAQYLNHREEKSLPAKSRTLRGYITVRGARENNLKNLEAKIPLGVFACLTGVSGSGKSTLMHNILFAGYKRCRGDSRYEVGQHDEILGADQIEDMILVDQSPLSRSLRSNPATYLKAYDEIRKVLASSFDARQRGLSASDFSFNIPGGRCEQCKGTGITIVDMHFLADVAVVCEACEGKRFKKRILEVQYKGANVAQILDMTVDRAMDFFGEHPSLIKGLRPLSEVGLGYLRLGQNTATLSGGEAQRLKLAAHLVDARYKKNYLMLFDEPTTGLHLADLHVLIGVLNRLVDAGHSLLVIEHNLELIRHADYVIDLGPEGGDKGGHIVAQGTLRTLLKSKKSFTAQFLREYLSIGN
jgi:excinuclease ABC subunit A